MLYKLNAGNFKETVASGKTLVDFWANWCGPCRLLEPIVEEMAVELGDAIKIGKIDIEESTELAVQYGVMTIPTLILFQDGEVVDKKLSGFSKEEIRAWIEEK